MESARATPADDLRRIFTLLMRRTLWHDFRFPQGGAALRTTEACAAALERSYGALSGLRMADFCICQGYAIAGFDTAYRMRWQPAHSFGVKARERFGRLTPGQRYHQQRWLGRYHLSSELLAAHIERREHPLARFIDTPWEEPTKRRLLSTPAGYIVCGCSTLLWAPHSDACAACHNAATCRQRTQQIYPELYRLRCEALKQT